MASYQQSMRLLVIGLDPATLDPSSRSAARQVAYYRGYQADIVVFATGTQTEIELGPGIRVFRAGGSSKLAAFVSTLKLLRTLRRSNRYDVVTIQEPVACGALALLSGKRIPIHLQDHSAMFTRRPNGIKQRIVSIWAKHVARRADRIRTVSERGKRGFESLGIDARNIDVVPVATDVSAFERVMHVAANNLRFLTIARLSREKGVDVLLRAFKTVYAARPDATLTIVGDGPERTALEQLTTSLDLGSSVVFAGQQSNPAEYLATADIYVQPSRFEGWGMAVIEAAAARMPIVMSDVGCAGEVIVNWESGVVVPPEDEQALATSVLALADDPARAARLAHAAQRAAKRLPSVESSVEAVRRSLEATSFSPFLESPLKLFLMALAVRLVLFGVIFYFVGPRGFELGDSQQYLGLAQSLLHGQGFLLDGIPYAYKTGGYPLLLAGSLWLFHSTVGAVLFQLVIASFLPVVILTIGRQLKLGRRATWGAAWLMAFEPHIVFYSLMILTETWYVLALLVGVVFLFRVFERRRLSDSVVAGVCFGVGMMIKPLLQFFPPLLLVAVLPWWRRLSWKQIVKHAAVIFLIVGAICTPWAYRNYRTFGTWSLSTQGSSILLSYLSTSIVSVRDQVTYQAAEAKIRAAFTANTGLPITDDGTDKSRAFRDEAMKYIVQNPLIVVRIMAVNTVSFWISSNYATFLNYYHAIPAIDHSVLPPAHYLAQGRIGEFISSAAKIFGQPFYAIGIVEKLLWMCIFVSFVCGLVHAFRKNPEKKFFYLFVVALCVYLTLTVWVEGLGIEARLRVPLMPFEFLFATYAWGVWRRKRAHHPMRLLVVTQRVDAKDPNLAVHIRWLATFAAQMESVTVITQSMGTYQLPPNVRVLSLGKEAGAPKWRQLFRFVWLIWRESKQADAILVLMVPLYVLLAAKAALFRRVPMFLWYTHKRVSWTLRCAMLFVRRVYSASPESFRLQTSKVRFIGHAIDTQFFAPDPSRPRQEGELVTVGRVAPVKRLELLIGAVDVLRRSGKNVRLTIIGSPIIESDRAYEATLHEQVTRLGQEDAVVFRGAQSELDVRRAYQTAGVCLNASATGSLDKAILEAMACGCPVVTSNEAFAGIVGSGFVRQADPDQIAEAIRRSVAQPVSSEQLRAEILSHHDLLTNLSILVHDIERLC